MKTKQIINLLKVALICTALMFGCEVIFYHQAVTDWFGNLIINAGVWVWVVIWLIMFIQVWLIPIPAYVVISAGVTLALNNFIFFGVTITAYIAGCVVAYWIGRKWGNKAVKWCAGSQEEADKWCKLIGERGKWWYALTVVLPIFPDDLLCFVCGSVKMNFWFYLVANSVCRAIGLATALLCLNIINLGSGLATIIVEGVLLVGLLILWIILEIKKRRV